MSKETLKLAEHIVNIQYEKIPQEAVKEAKRRIADIVGVGIYASKETAGKNISKYVGSITPHGTASVWNSGIKAAPSYAVMANAGSIFHVELDDVHRLSHTHPAASAIPPALALGEVMRSSGKSLIEAVIAGYEAVIRIGMAVSPSVFLSRACMPCAIIGPMGTAASAGKMLGLSVDLMAGAIASATFLAPLTPVESYTKGATIKEFSMGWAGFLGVTAAQMSQVGFTGSLYALETDFGYCHNVCDSYDLSRITNGMGDVFEIVNAGIKPYAHCRQHHSTIDCILDLREKHNLDARFKDVKHVLVRTFNPAVRGKSKDFPTISAAKYSIPYAVAVSMVFGDAWIGQYVEENLKDARIIDIAQKVDVVLDPECERLYDEKWVAIVEVEMQDGTKYTTRRDLMKGEPEHPLSDADLHKKFMSLAERSYDEKKAQRIWDKIFEIENIDNLANLVSEFE
jgi:2-methylcitrate dehydratase PrpD